MSEHINLEDHYDGVDYNDYMVEEALKEIEQTYFPDEINEFFKNHIIGKTVSEIRGAIRGSDHITFMFTDGSWMKMYNSQYNCDVDDICGDIDDLINSPILGAFQSTSKDSSAYLPARDCYNPSYTWTFYKFRTYNGYVDIRWYGHSSGYYSESINIEYHDGQKENTYHRLKWEIGK